MNCNECRDLLIEYTEGLLDVHPKESIEHIFLFIHVIEGLFVKCDGFRIFLQCFQTQPAIVITHGNKLRARKFLDEKKKHLIGGLVFSLLIFGRPPMKENRIKQAPQQAISFACTRPTSIPRPNCRLACL